MISPVSTFNNQCVSCKVGKAYRLPFIDVKYCYGTSFYLIHYDVWESPMLSNLDFQHYVVFMDDCTCFTWIYPMKHNYEVFQHFCAFHKLVENMFNRKIKIFRSDGGKKSNNDPLKAYSFKMAYIFENHALKHKNGMGC